MIYSYNKFFVIAAAALVLSACGSSQQTAPNSFPGASVEDKSVYLARGPHVSKFDLANGTLLWQYPSNTDAARGPFAGQPIKIGNTLIVGEGVGAGTRYLFGINAENGAEQWRFGAPREFVDGAVTDGKLVFVPNGDGVLYALDVMQMENNAPKVVWQLKTDNKLWSRPLLNNGRLYQASMDHKLFAVDAASGKEIWQFAEASAPIVVQPALKNGVLYFGALDSNFYAVDATSGKLVWKQAVDGWIWTDASVTDSQVVFANVKGRVYAYDLNGNRKWTFDAQDSVRAQPVANGDLIYIVSMDTNVYALNASDGSIKWKNDTLKYRLPSKPILSDGTLYVPLFDSDTSLWSLDPASGTRKIQFPPAKQ